MVALGLVGWCTCSATFWLGLPDSSTADPAGIAASPSNSHDLEIEMKKISLTTKLDAIADYWDPKIVAELNGQHVKLAKIKGEFIWHHHEHEDELFLMLDGRMTMHLRDGAVELEKGDCLVVPRGVEHKPEASQEAHILMFEPAGTLNTGNLENELTKSDPEHI
jgi:mannose-6-phosphate isomerase-like protein (cupin superfamily)